MPSVSTGSLIHCTLKHVSADQAQYYDSLGHFNQHYLPLLHQLPWMSTMEDALLKHFESENPKHIFTFWPAAVIAKALPRCLYLSFRCTCDTNKDILRSAKTLPC